MDPKETRALIASIREIVSLLELEGELLDVFLTNDIITLTEHVTYCKSTEKKGDKNRDFFHLLLGRGQTAFSVFVDALLLSQLAANRELGEKLAKKCKPCTYVSNPESEATDQCVIQIPSNAPHAVLRLDGGSPDPPQKAYKSFRPFALPCRQNTSPVRRRGTMKTVFVSGIEGGCVTLEVEDFEKTTVRELKQRLMKKFNGRVQSDLMLKDMRLSFLAKELWETNARGSTMYLSDYNLQNNGTLHAF